MALRHGVQVGMGDGDGIRRGHGTPRRAAQPNTSLSVSYTATLIRLAFPESLRPAPSQIHPTRIRQEKKYKSPFGAQGLISFASFTRHGVLFPPRSASHVYFEWR